MGAVGEPEEVQLPVAQRASQPLHVARDAAGVDVGSSGPVSLRQLSPNAPAQAVTCSNSAACAGTATPAG